MTRPIKPRCPASSPSFPPSTSASNPYNFTSQLQHASNIPPKHTSSGSTFSATRNSTTHPEACFSQWFASRFTGPGNPDAGGDTPISFPTAEHSMVYHKALLMGDDEIAEKILGEPHPSVGGRSEDLPREVWNVRADRVVEEGNLANFAQNEDLLAVLVGTGDMVLVEARIWGIRFNSEDAEGREDEWGQNRLGKAFVKARDRLKPGKMSGHGED